MPRRLKLSPPPLGDFFPLEGLSPYLLDKGARLRLGQVELREHLTTKTTKVYTVRGDSGARYVCWVLPGHDPWLGACQGGGLHDLLPKGRACSHPVAGAADWALRDGWWRTPPEGLSAAGCLAAARTDQAAAADLDLSDPLRVELLTSAVKWNRQALWLLEGVAA